MLTKEIMQQINEEENYRQEIRKKLEDAPPPQPKNNIFEFLNSTFFLALLSTLLVPMLISNYQSKSQKIRETEVLLKKIDNERSEIKNRIDIICRIDTSGILGEEFTEIKNAFKGFDSTGGFSLNEQFAKRNIFSLLADYKYDLGILEDKREPDSVKLNVSIISENLQIAYNYIQGLSPFMFGTLNQDVILLDKKDAMKNPSKVDVFTSGDHEANSLMYFVVLPKLKDFH
jgi:hypothetical protein